jgi:predicted GNAT family N-acyltransferase
LDITHLEKRHNRKNFKCEVESLNQYLRNQVSQDIRKGLATCFIAADDELNVIGYYTLSSESLGRESVPEKYVKKIPDGYNVPVILLGRLARDIRVKGTGLGEYLLIDALFRSHRISKESIGAMAVVVDPINEFAFEFYQKYGFIPLPDSERMFLPMRLIEKLK